MNEYYAGFFVVFDSTKILILKQFTTDCELQPSL